jgi:hypothetical protein
MSPNRITSAVVFILLMSYVPMTFAQHSSPDSGRQPTESDDLSVLRRIDAHTPPDVQVRLAQSAGPAVGAAATIYVLGETGYTKFREGTNGFSCLIERQRVDTIEPECFDREGTATTLKARLFVEERRAKRKTEAQITAEVEAGYKSGKFIAPRKPGLVYMMSAYNYVLDPDSGRVIHFPGHLMFYAPYATAEDTGVGPGAPFLVSPGRPDALMIVVPASHR